MIENYICLLNTFQRKNYIKIKIKKSIFLILMLKQNTYKENFNIHQEILFLTVKLIYERSPPI